MRISPISGQPFAHEGVDLSAALGTPIHAVADGTVVEVSSNYRSGTVVKIKHTADDGRPFYTAYLHEYMDDILVTVGQQAKAGQRIGAVGSNGWSTEPHLHPEVHDARTRPSIPCPTWTVTGRSTSDRSANDSGRRATGLPARHRPPRWRGRGPENSMAAFQRLDELGVHHLETDAHVSADGVVVLSHDPVVDRTYDGSGAIIDMTWREISQLRNAAGERMPTLAEVLEAHSHRLVQHRREVRRGRRTRSSTCWTPTRPSTRHA